MQTRSRTMKIMSGKDINRKFTAKFGSERISGSKAVINIIITIIMQKANIRNLNFIGSIIKERLFCVNIASSSMMNASKIIRGIE